MEVRFERTSALGVLADPAVTVRQALAKSAVTVRQALAESAVTVR